MAIGKQERLLLSAAQLNGELTALELAARTGIKVHTVHYLLRRFKEKKLLRRWTFLDMFALGFEEIEVYFSLASASRQTKAALTRLLKDDPRVIWFATLGGDYQFAMTMCVRGAQEAMLFLDAIARKFGNILCKKSITNLLEFHILAKKHLVQGIKKAPDDSVSMILGVPKADLDETDFAILSEINNPDHESSYDLAKLTGIPRATVDYRLKKLQEKGVIKRTIYFIDGSQLDLQIFKILVFARGVTAGLAQGIFKLAHALPQVVNVTRTLGAWDYELGVEAANAEGATAVVESLYEEFGQDLQDVQILPIFSQSNSTQFLKTLRKRAVQ